MNKLKINGYRLYGDAELIISDLRKEMVGDMFKNYMAPSLRTIELICSGCNFNKGSQKKKGLQSFAYNGEHIEVSFLDDSGCKYEGLFVISELKCKDGMSFTAISTGQITITPGEL